MQFDLRTLFIVLVILYACLGFVCLFLPYRMPGSRAVSYWGYAMLTLTAGMAGIALRGLVPDFISVVIANAVTLTTFVFVLASVRQGHEAGSYLFAWSVICVAVLLLAYFTYVLQDTRIRIAIVSAAIALLTVQPVLTLIAAAEESSRRARLFTAFCVIGVGLLMLARALLTIKWGANPDFLAPDFVQFGSILLFGVFVVLGTLGVVWIETAQLQSDLARLAMLDPLTETLNRRAFMLEYERELSRCVREKTGLALAIFDLDHFKDVNDSHGHLAGDQVLRSIADTLRASLRGHDVLGRYGGEEFSLLMPGADMTAAMAAAERARLAVGARPVEVGSLTIPISVSAGVATYGANGSDWESLLSSADAALYEAKHKGRNRVVAAPGAAAPAACAKVRSTSK
ncbi:MAG: GGDEF domain-containing protein [Betaproteobacteria bacterium]|nr:MAG: GGDEF domain-containing protein [Betaproteobacteria bacterium]